MGLLNYELKSGRYPCRIVRLESRNNQAASTVSEVRTMHSSDENQSDFLTNVLIVAVCTVALEVVYIAIFIVRYKRTRRYRRGYPNHWSRFDNTVATGSGHFKLVPLHNNNIEYKIVLKLFQFTIPHTKYCIQRIERIQNKILWRRYYDCAKRMMDQNPDGKTNEMNLFHGTRNINPEDIYKGDNGFDMRYSNQGMWGKGNYFAVNALYSDAYAHTTTDGCRQMLMATVLTGRTHECSPDSSITIPPVIRDDEPGKVTRRYDSVTGDTQGSKVYITYENDRAYPAYLITYK